MVGPSASGSLNGTPSSIISVPASSSASTKSSVVSIDGSPAVMYATMPISPAARRVAKHFSIRFGRVAEMLIIYRESLEQARVSVHVLVAAAGKIEYDQVIFMQRRKAFYQACKSMRGFQRRDNSFAAAKQSRGIQRRIV